MAAKKQQFEIGIQYKSGAIAWERMYGLLKTARAAAKGYSLDSRIDLIAIYETRSGKRLFNYKNGVESVHGG